MANNLRPRGFKPYGRVKQAIPQVAGGTVYAGEFVTLANTGKVTQVAAGAVIYGLCLDNGAADGTVMVSVDPEQLYIGVCSSDASIDAQTDIGNCADIVATAGDSTFKAARQSIDASTIAASSAQLLVLAITNRPNNAGGAYAEALVKINEHQAFGKDAFAGI